MRDWARLPLAVCLLVGVFGCSNPENSDAPGSTTVTAQASSPTQGARPTLPAPMTPPGSFRDGMQVVGKDIKPGTYRTRARAPGCYWARLAGFSGEIGDFLANGNESGPMIVTISPRDKGFESRKCGLWSPDLSAITKSIDAPFSDGTFIIGTDIAPGTWRADAPESCYWARLRGFSGGGKDTISNANYNGIVTIEATDTGFKSDRCGTWTKVN